MGKGAAPDFPRTAPWPVYSTSVNASSGSGLDRGLRRTCLILGFEL